jgi:putative endonuclease
MIDAITYYVYLLLSQDRQYRYVGRTKEPGRRLSEHNSGHTASTSLHRPYTMVLIRRCVGRLDARKVEKHFKSGHGRKALDRLLALPSVVARIRIGDGGVVDLTHLDT